MLGGRADAPDATLLRALAAAQLDAATRPTISFLHVSAAGGTSLCLTARAEGQKHIPWNLRPETAGTPGNHWYPVTPLRPSSPRPCPLATQQPWLGHTNSSEEDVEAVAADAPPSATAADPTQEPAAAPRRGKKPRKKKARGARSAPAG